ncbi:MAG: valine--tRNA ligase [Candidatus Niyogibacteria bacterium]|nr:valine--tRNA ligase [Candidatus Niyogibacteria bacterium]
MTADFSKPYDPKEVEGHTYEAWLKAGYFNPDQLTTKGKPYTLVIPPPNVTGSLHMGHALNATIQDILIRKKRMEGRRALWIPGTDHAGIATQNVVEKSLRKEGIFRHELGREKFLEKVWEWKEKYGNIILDQLKKLGASCDWSRTRFTMDPKYQKIVAETFAHYYKKGWIYRKERVISWCHRCRTSLSDLELEYQETKGSLWFIKYPLAETAGYVVVATTRPETMLGDSAVAVHPKDPRYANLVGQFVMLPLQDRKIPIIADRRIEKEFGTGAVKVTPAHDMLDAEIGNDHHLAIYKIIGSDGKMTPEAGSLFAGLKIEECRKKVVEELEKQNLIEKIEEYRHNISTCYRCRTPIEPLPSLQWFLKMDDLARRASIAVNKQKVIFHPDRWKKIYLSWLKNVKDWTISRQIWWGHRLPVYFCENKQEENFIVATTPPKKCPFCQNCEMRQSEEVLDTWFSSALWPFATLQYDQRDFKKFYPTQTLSTARDIINLWVARMVFSSLEFTKKIPFQNVIIHATILTKDGQRMSKSLGTGIDPINLINLYGADATRFGLIWQAMKNQDMHWAEESLVAGKKFLNKIWNASRFVLERVTDAKFKIATNPKFSARITKQDSKILKKLEVIVKNTDQNIEKYNFGPALHDLYSFFWHDFCDIYLEVAKKQLEDPKLKLQTQKILLHVLATSLKLLHPFIPFVTEEIWSALIPAQAGKSTTQKRMLIIESWPKKR